MEKEYETVAELAKEEEIELEYVTSTHLDIFFVSHDEFIFHRPFLFPLYLTFSPGRRCRLIVC